MSEVSSTGEEGANTGTSGEYSAHGFSRMFNSAGGTLPPTGTVINKQPVYFVNRGQQVQIEMTTENAGTTDVLSVPYSLYISPNNVISTTDTFLRSGTLTASRGIPMQSNFTVTLPSALVVGQTYWVGIVLDPNNVITEIAENNNAAFLPVRVR